MLAAPRDDDEVTNDDNPGDTGDQYRGYLVDLLKALAEHASFSYSLYAVDDRRRGDRRQDGTWTGLVGEIIAGVRIPSITIYSNQHPLTPTVAICNAWIQLHV